MTDDIGDRIQRRILSEVREKLAETERKLEIVEGQVKRLSDTILNKQRVMDDKIKYAQAQIALVAEKDNEIAMLQRRCANLNDEMNGKRFRQDALGMSQAEKKAMAQQGPPRIATTLEDVYKLTGEPYSKDERC